MIKPGQYKWSTNGFIFANITKNCILSPAWQFANVSLMTLANCHAGLKMHPNNDVTDKYFANKSSKTAGSIVHHVMVDNHQIIRCFFLSNNKLCRTTHNVQSEKFHTYVFACKSYHHAPVPYDHWLSDYWWPTLLLSVSETRSVPQNTYSLHLP